MTKVEWYRKQPFHVIAPSVALSLAWFSCVIAIIVMLVKDIDVDAMTYVGTGVLVVCSFLYDQMLLRRYRAHLILLAIVQYSQQIDDSQKGS